MSFQLDLKAFADKVSARANLVVRKIVLDVGTAIVEKSPVGDGKYWKKPPPPGYTGGRFRANWQYGLTAPNKTTTEETDKDGQATINRILAALGETPAGEVHYLTNSLPYAQRIEEGHSQRQAPTGVVGITVLEFRPIVEAAARAVT